MVEGGIDAGYFMDKMQMYELQPILSNLYKKNKDSWEQTRLLAYMIVQVKTTQAIKQEDILKFAWDEKPDTSITESEIEILKNKAQLYKEVNGWI